MVSVGNLTTGGTGKTPAVAALAKWALTEKFRVAIISRGYGGAYQSPVLEVSDGQRVRANSRVAGDEPVLLAQKVTGSPVVLSRESVIWRECTPIKGSDLIFLSLMMGFSICSWSGI